eukprot:TRINITY_DN978_c0_g1_i1.p1 TRINITY_DN978_c0_g1~~TRINITY_DN978_c0_g1_i1.p1  ORF type:complete len:1474 (-),score=244.23 TRINITY_DN978_c0_g1_i1:2419-6840(-)
MPFSSFRPYFGFTLNDARDPRDGLPRAAVVSVDTGGPASRAGLIAGDILLRVNRDEVLSRQHFATMLGNLIPEQPIFVEIFRPFTGDLLDIELIGEIQLARDASTTANADLQPNTEQIVASSGVDGVLPARAAAYNVKQVVISNAPRIGPEVGRNDTISIILEDGAGDSDDDSIGRVPVDEVYGAHGHFSPSTRSAMRSPVLASGETRDEDDDDDSFREHIPARQVSYGVAAVRGNGEVAVAAASVHHNTTHLSAKAQWADMATTIVSRATFRPINGEPDPLYDGATNLVPIPAQPSVGSPAKPPQSPPGIVPVNGAVANREPPVIHMAPTHPIQVQPSMNEPLQRPGDQSGAASTGLVHNQVGGVGDKPDTHPFAPAQSTSRHGSVPSSATEPHHTVGGIPASAGSDGNSSGGQPTPRRTGANPTKDDFFNIIERKQREQYQSFGAAEGIAASLGSDLSRGIEASTAADRAEKWGRNVLPEAEKITFLGLVLEALHDRMMQLLIVAAIVSIIFGMTLKNPHTGKVDRETGWIEGTAILISVAIVVLVSSVNDYQKAKKFRQLSDLSSKKEVVVIRDGQRITIDIDYIVVGDLLCVEGGQTLSADAVYVQGQDLKCDESSATGESDVQHKDPVKDPFFISGTNVTEGDGMALVIGVGENSFAGRLTMKTRGPPSSTPLQVKLSELADQIGKAGLLGGLFTFIILSIKEIVKLAQKDHKFNIAAFLNYLLVSVALIVVAIPEGLPLAVTIALAFSMKAMLQDNCLVRVLASCETMGGTSAVCSDKTGTLTANQMTVVQGWLAREHFLFDGYGCSSTPTATVTPVGAEVKLASPPQTVQLMCESISLNSSVQTEEKLIDGKLVWCGNKTETGLLGWVKRAGKDYKAIRESVPPSRKKAYPFSSSKKRMTTIVQQTADRQIIHVKGASELVLQDCKRVLTQDGTSVEITEAERKELEDTISMMAKQGNRTIGVAFAEANSSSFPPEEPYPEITLIGILGIQDPIRPEVPLAVESCRRAGIVVRMVTGDNMQTAIAIAKKCGIYTSDEECTALEGETFRRMCKQDPQKVIQLLPRLRVLARSSPTDKHVLVACLMDEGEIVAVTGDGTNDAPALKLADVGFAMNTGTDVAKGASDMVLLDDNFASVVKATKWGRTVNDNIRKFLQFQLTVNIAGVLLTMIGSATSDNNEEPLRPVQLLWLNLIMDTLAALALATERPTEECLNRPPIFRAAPLISRRMMLFIGFHAVYQTVVTLVIANVGHTLFKLPPCNEDDLEHGGHTDGGHCKQGLKHSSLVFNSFIWMQLFNQFNARLLYGGINPFRGLFRSWMMLVLFFIEAGFQVFAVEGAGKFMGTTHLNGPQWAACIIIGLVELPLGLIQRLIPVPEWKPKNAEDNKKAMDAGKRETVKRAKVDAGMYGSRAPTPLDRFKAAGEQVRHQLRVASAFEVAGRQARGNRRRDHSSQTYFTPHMGMPLNRAS